VSFYPYPLRENHLGPARKIVNKSTGGIWEIDKRMETPPGNRNLGTAVKSHPHVSICFCFDKPSGLWFSYLENDVIYQMTFTFRLATVISLEHSKRKPEEWK
jgi:hypothetical protein